MSIQKEWQRIWREALGEPTDSMPGIRDDYALHFDIWSIGEEKLNECFSIFPNGDLLLNRVTEVLKSAPETTEIDDHSLLCLLEKMNQNIEAVLRQYGDQEFIELNAEKSEAGKRSVYRGNEALRHEVLGNADNPTIHLDDALCEIIKKYHGKEGYESKRASISTLGLLLYSVSLDYVGDGGERV